MRIKNRIISLVILLSALNLYCNAQDAQELPSMKTLKTLLLANRYFAEQWPDPARPVIIGDKEYSSNNLTRSIYYEGLMALYKINPNTAIADLALRWGAHNNWTMQGGIETTEPDNLCCAQTYIDLYMLDRYKEERIKTVRACIDKIIVSDAKNLLDRTDALQTVMPVFARLGKIYNDEKYFDRMHEMYVYTRTMHGGTGLYNAEDKLWWSDKDFLPPYKESNGENCYWSRANGWVVAALVRTLEFLPDNMKYRKDYENTIKDMFEALVPLQREDGFWNVSLKNPDNFGGKELTGTSLFVYGMAWAINEGIINKKDYQPVVMKAWEAILNDCVHPDGSLGFVQGTGKGPKDGQPVGYDIKPDTEDFGLGCFLLAGSEMYKLLKSLEPKEKEVKEKGERKKEKVKAKG